MHMFRDSKVRISKCGCFSIHTLLNPYHPPRKTMQISLADNWIYSWEIAKPGTNEFSYVKFILIYVFGKGFIR